MPIDYSTDLSGRINTLDFAMVIGSAALSADFQKVTIPYTGSANPARTSSVDIVSTEYSLDDGVTWADMTLDSGSSDTTNLTFDADGESYNIVWMAKADIGTQVYNNNIKIRFRAQDAFGADTVVATKMRYLFFPRTVSNQVAATSSPFPNDYAGIPGMDLLKNAPRQQS